MSYLHHPTYPALSACGGLYPTYASAYPYHTPLRTSVDLAMSRSALLSGFVGSRLYDPLNYGAIPPPLHIGRPLIRSPYSVEEIVTRRRSL
eukprot:NODE_8059_length_390_cov_6.376426_g7893_i0.p1 GENE.NODE_8059_length_390_cov_6.376426_g7893_i0~~NODE_8059_length_390_cov_6.376426_g7893_i0.p1  ORF type:complete len:107 (+),score=12.78 NODE_8059_length_390_cov_6.376426_g7893_i0:51-323(+)